MKVIAISEFQPDSSSAADQSALLAESGRVLDDLHQRGILQHIYLRKDVPGTVIIMECGTVDDAHLYMNSLPGVAAKKTTYRIVALGSEIPPNALKGARMAQG